MGRRTIGALLGAVAGLLVAAAPAAAQSGGEGVRVMLGARNAKTTLSSSTENGVRIWRPQAAVPTLLAGGAPERQARVVPEKQVIVVRVIKNPARRLRTQGFYTGRGQKARSYAQGFYSGQKTYRRGTFD